uniref:E5 n=1 Tax=Heterorhabditis bacteriophora TaxID=37862 RepID=A0A1I7WE63_HETBA
MSGCVRWYLSRCLIFGSLLFKWIGMVLLAAISLALVAGFIVLIALILLPIIILLTTLCCNNSCEKYKQAVEDGRLENCSDI